KLTLRKLFTDLARAYALALHQATFGSPSGFTPCRPSRAKPVFVWTWRQASPGELLVLHRAELQRALYEQLPPGSVDFNCPCTGYARTNDGALAHFEGRDSARGWLVVGADGLHFAIRAQLKGPEPPRYAGYVCWRGVCPVPTNWCGTAGEIWGQGDRFGVVRLPGDRLYWFAVASAPQKTQSPVGAACKEVLLERFAHYAFDV